MFDCTSYFVTVGLSNTVQLRLLGNYSGMLELLESLLGCLVRHFFSLLFLFPLLFQSSEDVLFNLRVSSLTESDLYQHASEFHKL